IEWNFIIAQLEEELEEEQGNTALEEAMQQKAELE
uniref:Myosin II heavy chain non-muscle (Fragments) n=1 Tax=Cricetidae sp. TaxID=36483 RepID=Q7M0E5_CRISP